MSVDDLARSAAQQLRSATEREVDPMTLLAELHRTNTRRRAALGATAVAAVVAVIAAVAIVAPGDDGAPVPAGTPSTTPSSRGEVLLMQAGIGRLAGYGGSLPHVPTLAGDPLSSLSFAPDGGALAYVVSPGVRAGGGRADGEVRVLDEQTGAERGLGPCRYPCPVAWSPDGRVVLTAASGALRLLDASTGSATEASLPAGWVVDGLDVNAGGRVAITGSVGSQPALMAVDLDGGSPRVVKPAGGHAWVTEPRWSPDGRSLAYVQRSAAFEDMTADANFSLRTVTADGTGDRGVAVLGHCVCGGVLPGMDWSPDGQIAVAPSNDPFTVFTVTLDGAVKDTGQRAGGPVAWRPAP